jgi:hypothetical protein
MKTAGKKWEKLKNNPINPNVIKRRIFCDLYYSKYLYETTNEIFR